MTPQEKARILRPIIEKASTSLDDSYALIAVELFPKWDVDIEYAAQFRVRYGNKLYRCEQAHTSQTGWEPPNVQALWTEVAEPGTIPVWRQPTGAQDAYRLGDKVHYPTENDPVYISTIDYNTYAPDVYGWELES